MRWIIVSIGFAAALTFASSGATPPENVDAEIAAFTDWLQKDWPDELYRNDDPEHLLVGALLAQRPALSKYTAGDFFKRALAGDPDNTLILHDVAAFCLIEPKSTVCGPAHLRRLSQLDSTNGAVWTMRSWERYHANDYPAALRYLRRAATAEEYDDYFLRHMTLFDQVLRAYLPATPAKHYVRTIGLTAGVAIAGYRMVTPCRERAAGEAEWRHQCLALGRAMEQRSRTELSVAMGISLQIAMLKLADEPEALAAAEDRQARPRKILGEQTKAMESFPMDDPLWHEFFSTFVSEGEQAAHELAVQRAADRSPGAAKD